VSVKFAWLAAHESYQPEVLVDQAVLAEQVGFEIVTAADHFHPWVDDESAAGFLWSWLGTAAARTQDVVFVSSVTCPLFHYHPALIAQAAATVDRLSGGRFVLGVGTGENINEGPLGYEFPGYGERIRRMREALEIMDRLLAGEKVDFDGTYYKTRKAKLYSPPLHYVPIWMAAGGQQSATFAGKHTAGLITSVKIPAETIENIIKPFQEARDSPGAIMATRWVVWADSDEEAWLALGSMRGLRAPGRLEEVDPAVLRKRADQMDRNEILSKYTIVNDAAGLIEAYRPLVQDVGADVVSVQVASLRPKETINLIGNDVLPELRKLSSTPKA
jgi:coenzyme F420-dependent glucose-6-phosphate dehydrogenase